MNPLLVMAILQAASMGANYVGQKKVDKGRAAAMREARERRGELEKRSDASAQSTTDILTGAAGKEAAAAAEREAAVRAARDAVNPLTQQTTQQLATSTLAPVGSTRVIEDAARERGDTSRFLNQQARARANLDAFGDVAAGNNIAVRRNAQDIGQVGQSLQNWNQYVLPAQMNAANMAGRNWNTLGDVFQLANAIYSPIGLSTQVPGAVAGTAATKGVGTAAGRALGAGVSGIAAPGATASAIGAGVGRGALAGGMSVPASQYLLDYFIRKGNAQQYPGVGPYN